MNKEWILFHLTEARDEINKTLTDIHGNPDYNYAEFWVAMQHLYHHVNTAWNSRELSEAQVREGTDEGFSRWSQFPKDLPMMGL